MEAEIIKINFTPDHLADSKDEGADEAIPIHIRKEITTKSYKEKMSQDIKHIDTYETSTKVNITQCRSIYEVIDEVYIKESNIPLIILSENVKIIQTKHNLYQVI